MVAKRVAPPSVTMQGYIGIYFLINNFVINSNLCYLGIKMHVQCICAIQFEQNKHLDPIDNACLPGHRVIYDRKNINLNGQGKKNL